MVMLVDLISTVLDYLPCAHTCLLIHIQRENSINKYVNIYFLNTVFSSE